MSRLKNKTNTSEDNSKSEEKQDLKAIPKPKICCIDIDDDAFPTFANPDFSASSASGWSAGINWYLNRNVRLNASYSYTTFEGGGGTGIGGGTVAPAIVTRQPEQVFFTRVQLSF